MCKRFGPFNRERRSRAATPMTSEVDSRLENTLNSGGMSAGIFLEHGQGRLPGRGEQP
jgi:hypothetical protein